MRQRAAAALGLLALLCGACGEDKKAASPTITDANNGDNNGGADMGAPDQEDMEASRAPDGSACTAAEQCQGGACLSEADGYPGGACTTLGCAQGAACQGDAQCAFLDEERAASACFPRCGEGDPCREGYECRTFGEASFCLPAPPPEPEPLPDGAPCARREDCQGGFCLTEDDGFPGGMCTSAACRNLDDCHGAESLCLLSAQPTYCVQRCERQDDCREGYICQPIQGGAFCAPSPTAGTFVPQEGDLPFGVSCGETLAEEDAFQGGLDRHTLRFSIPEGATSFMVVPYSPGGQIYPVALTSPTRRLDIFGEYNFALANAGFLINLSPLLMPQAPQFASFVEAGAYELDVAAGQDLCHYVLPKRGRGSQLDLNFYFVGAADLDAESAGENERFQRALESFNAIYGQQGAGLRFVRYNDITGADEARFRVIRSQEAVFRLVTLAAPPGEGADDLLSVNVFFIDDFAIPGGSVLGISAGLPGAAGFHGGRGSGLVFSAAVLGDPELLGQVLAHEVGHYLGLFHTTEQGGVDDDPLADTPACAPNLWRNPGQCPDITNLMFPFAGDDHMVLTGDQGEVIHANPLVK
jgi:hypothetical protein